MNKPISLCDRCKEYARCCLNYDGGNCRRARTVEPTNADKIRSMTDEELASLFSDFRHEHWCPPDAGDCVEYCTDCWLAWLKQEIN